MLTPYPLDRGGTLREARACRLLASLLILLTVFLRLAYLASDDALDLSPDEAHYWDWSRNLDWSYYSKGPLVAWLIRASCEVFGPLSERLTGTQMLAVRLPAVLCGALLLAAIYTLTVQVYRRERLALAVVAVAVTMPVIAAGSSLMTIDAPYTCCWAWALVLAHRAVFRDSGWCWPLLGLVVGVGILAKYNMAGFVPSLGLFLLFSGTHRRHLFRPGFWLMGMLAAGCCLPILIWNIRNDWVTLHHVNSLAGGMKSGKGFHPLGPLNYVAGQCALLLVFWFLAWAGAMFASRPTVERDEGKCYLWWLSAPMFALFLAFSFKTGGGELNWPVTAYLSGVVLAVGWVAEQFRSPSPGYRRLVGVGMGLSCGIGLLLSVAVHRMDWVRPVLLSFVRAPSPEHPLPLRRVDPTCRLRGWQTLAADVDRLRDELRAEGIEPLLAGTHWTLPGELGFYCHDHPPVYSIGLVLGDRHSQYDLWQPNPVADGESFRGRTFIVVGGVGDETLAAFARVEPVRTVTHYEDGQPLAIWHLFVCRDFHGFPEWARKKAGY